jgi:hypothetical protein
MACVWSAACLVLLLVVSSPLSAGDKPKPKPKDYALIFGTVWAPDNTPVHGIEVNIRPADHKRAKWRIYSNGLGEFEQQVPAGKADYILWASTKGVKLSNGKHLQPSPRVTVHIESNERADTGLHLQ